MALMNLAMAASYDPDPRAPNGFRLPFDLDTGVLLEARWKRWLRHDPIHMVAQHRKALASLKGIYVDCGWRDQYHIHYGARQLSQQLSRYGFHFFVINRSVYPSQTPKNGRCLPI